MAGDGSITSSESLDKLLAPKNIITITTDAITAPIVIDFNSTNVLMFYLIHLVFCRYDLIF